MEPREQRLQVETFERRHLGAHDYRVVFAPVRPHRRQRPVTAGELVLEHDVGEVELDLWRERRDRRHAGEVASGIGDLVVGESGEGLTARAGHGRHWDEGQEAVLSGQVELGVYPLDLEQSGHVGVEV